MRSEKVEELIVILLTITLMLTVLSLIFLSLRPTLIHNKLFLMR